MPSSQRRRPSPAERTGAGRAPVLPAARGGWVRGARRLAASGLLLALAACRPAPPVSPGPPAPTLAAAIEEVLGSPAARRAHWGALVQDLGNGAVLYERQADRLFIPASNAKLATAVTALAHLGPDYRFVTEVLAPTPTDGVVPALIVVGRGDPTLSETFHPAPYAAMDSLADSIAIAGVRRVAGPLIVDASYFDDVPVLGSWEVGDLDATYAPPVAAFGVEEGVVRLRIAPGSAPGQPAIVETVPRPGLVALDSRVATSAPGVPAAIRFSRRVGGDALVVTGTVPASSAAIERAVAVPDAADHAARALRAALATRGITVDGEIRVVRGGAAPASPANAPPIGSTVALARWTSPPLAEITAAFLKDSRNWIAEQIVKTTGAEVRGEGSWAAGLDVQRRFLIDATGIDSTAFVLRDGSGLSVQNLLAPVAVVRLLDFARRQPWGPTFVAALPVAGEDGTLEDRLASVRGRVRAKTGTLTHVTTLSGYATTRGGRDIAFSILTQSSGRPGAEMRELVDRIVELIVDY